ncbi:MAG: RNA polymerase sigma factor [Candidatus Rokubacteria bacterium]|nr:RNA polymerase sigma factor [Candidatus Rokubacteria bacterium]
MMVVETDEQLIAGVTRGDWRALESLLRRYEGPLFGFFYRLGCRAGWCEDLVQTVMIRVYEQCGRYDASRRFAPWLYGIARNVWREHLRQRARDRAEPLEDGDAGTDDAADPLERAEVAEEIHLVRRALLRLPQEERLTLVLRHWQGLTYEEIAETLDVPLGTVKWRIHDAHRKLGGWLAVGGRWGTAGR